MSVERPTVAGSHNERRRQDLLSRSILSLEECARLVSFFRENIAHLGYAHESKFWDYRVINVGGLSDCERRHDLDAARDALIDAIRSHFGADRIYCQGRQLVHWPRGSSQPPHTDQYFEGTIFAAVVHLNDDFEGGRTYFPDLARMSTPRTGSAVVFRGGSEQHGVTEVKSGERFTAAMWFGDDSRHVEA